MKLQFIEVKEITLDELFEKYKSDIQAKNIISFEDFYDLYKDLYGYHII
jgi:hypothetical protein